MVGRGGRIITERAVYPDVIEYELLPRTALMRQGLDAAEDHKLGCMCHGEPSCGRGGAVSRWWWEKAWILVDQLQVFGAIWLATCPSAVRRFPVSWCGEITWSPYLNLDSSAKDAWDQRTLALNTTSLVPVGGGEGGGALWMIGAPALGVVALWAYFLLAQQHLKGYLGRSSRFVPPFERAIVRLGTLGYLPWNIYTSRHMACQEMAVVQEWQREYRCGTYDPSQAICALRSGCMSLDGSGAAALAGICASVLVTAFGFPLLVAWLVRRGVLFVGRRKHELWLQGIETEYVLRFSGYWAHHHYPLHSSFTRAWAYAPCYTMLFKLAFAWPTALAYEQTDGEVVRDCFIFGVLLLWWLAMFRFRAYRMQSSQHLALWALGANLLTMTPRFLMSLQFESQILFMLGFLLPLHNAIAALACLLTVAINLLARERWPVTAESIRVNDEFTCEVIGQQSEGAVVGGGGVGEDSDPESPRTPTRGSAGLMQQFLRESARVQSDLGDANTLGRSPRDGYINLGFPWVEGEGGGELVVARRVERARRVLLQEQSRTREFVRVLRLRSQIEKLQMLLRVLERAHQPLSFAVEDVLQETLNFHNGVCDESVYTYDPLRPMLPKLRVKMDARDAALYLAGPRLKRVLLKLFALRQFQIIRRDCATRRYKEWVAGGGGGGGVQAQEGEEARGRGVFPGAAPPALQKTRSVRFQLVQEEEADPDEF